MSDNKIQTSFAAGELAPSTFARVDLAKYHAGAATMRNFFVDYRSGASTRPGTQFVMEALDSSHQVRLIPFQYNTQATYMLEFGHQYIRFISNGAPVTETPLAITGASNTNPLIITVAAHAYTVGDRIYITGITGMIQLNNRIFDVLAIAGVNLTLGNALGQPVNAIPYGLYTGGGTSAKLYKITSPYIDTDLALLKYTQDANVMTITHPSYAPRNLTLTAPTAWTLTPIAFQTPALSPVITATATSAAGAANYSFIVTAVDANGQESTQSAPAALAAAVNIYAAAGTLTVTWAAVAGAVAYNVYQAEISIAGAVPGGVQYGLIGSATGLNFINSNISPNFALTPPLPTTIFNSANNYPAVNCFFQQRQCFAATNNAPTTFYMSTPGGYQIATCNMNTTDPTVDDDAITGTLSSLQVNAIKSMLPMPGGLILLTSKGAWQVSAGSGVASTSAVTPSNIVAVPQAYNGASDVLPLVINQDILYVQAKGSAVRDLSYNIYANIYTGTDVSILSNHLFYGYFIKEWTYAEEPFKLVWAVRNDGSFLSQTYVKEQEIYGWARHDTKGMVESVASITEGNADAVYFVVQRVISGLLVRYIERMASRVFTYGVEDAWAVDCGATNGLPTFSAILTATAASGNGVIFNASSAVFVAGSLVGQTLRVGGGKATITSNSTTQMIGNIIQTISDTIPGTTTPKSYLPGTWTVAPNLSTIYSLDFLEGQVVYALVDGLVQGPFTVSNGSINLTTPGSKIIIGLQFIAQLQTMYLDTGEPTIQGKRKTIPAVSWRLANSSGIKAGRNFIELYPVKQAQPYVTTVNGLVTWDERIQLPAGMDTFGQICLQQDQPLPCTVLGVIPEIVVGDK